MLLSRGEVINKKTVGRSSRGAVRGTLDVGAENTKGALCIVLFHSLYILHQYGNASIHRGEKTSFEYVICGWAHIEIWSF